jgi:hypothetical protein
MNKKTNTKVTAAIINTENINVPNIDIQKIDKNKFISVINEKKIKPVIKPINNEKKMMSGYDLNDFDYDYDFGF